MKDVEPKSVNSPLSVKAVGDICPGDKSILGLGVCSLMKKYGVDFPFRKVNAFFLDADIVLGNLEGVLSYDVENVHRPHITFCGPPLFATELKRLGFNVINVANNHTLEHGPQMFLETVDILQDAGIKVCGLRDTDHYYSKPVFMTRKGKTIGIIGYNWVGKDKFPEADKYIAQSHDSIVNYTWNRETTADTGPEYVVHERNKHVIDDIKKLKRKVDFLIITTHWAYEFIHYPPYGVTLEAHSFIDAGADLIIGAHPHVLQGMEQYKGKWIFYSLGNFLFDTRFEPAKNSAILDYQVGKDGKATFDLIYVKLNKHSQPTLAYANEKKRVCQIIHDSVRAITSPYKKTLLDDDILYKQFEKKYNRLKIANILRHIQAIPHNPLLIKLIARKVLNFAKLLALRAKGQKIRW